MSRVAFYTLGCKLNFSETSTIGNQFLNNGYEIVDFKEESDIYIINTCTVTDNADKECRQIVRRALRKNPNAFVAVTGCYAQLRPEEISAIDGVDLVIGSSEKFNLLNYVKDGSKNEVSCVYVSPTESLSEFNSAYSTDADGRTRAFLKIQDGCDYKCSFCTIPLARGKSRSSELGEVVSNFNDLIESGYKEIVLTGVNVGDYGKNVEGDLYKVLSEIVKVKGDFRIRISSIEPNLLTDEILKLTAENPKLVNHFHIPLQSGSDKILKLMQRRYRTEQYRDLIFKANDLIEDVGIGVDVIVGSPGETEEDFLETYNFIKELPVSYLHVFTYSERPNTKALSIEGKVTASEKKRRNNMLRILSEKKRNEFYRSMIGRELKVLFERDEHNCMMRGFASNYVRVETKFNNGLINKFVNVKIVDTADGICLGEPVNEKSIIKSVAI